MSTIKVNTIAPTSGSTVSVATGNDILLSGDGVKVVTPKVQGASGIAINAASNDVKIQLGSNDKLTVLSSPSGSNKTVNVLGDLYVSGTIYGLGTGLTGLTGVGAGGSSSAVNLQLISGFGSASAYDILFTTGTTTRATISGSTGNLSVDNGALFVDAVNNRVGVNTTAPAESLNVVGNSKVTGNSIVNGVLSGGIGATTAASTGSWDDAANRSSGSSTNLLSSSVTNGPGASSVTYHPFNFEYGARDGSGAITQMAVPSTIETAWNAGLAFRSRPSGVDSTWTGWRGIVHQPLSPTGGATGVTVNAGGQVGINQTSPVSTLDVGGGARVSGVLTLGGNGATVAGVAFPASVLVSNDANTLDDYEEGTFATAPTVSGITAGTIGYGSGNSGKYTKIGNRVFFDIVLEFQNSVANSASGALLVNGLPFSSAATTGNSAVAIGFRNGWSVTVANKPSAAAVIAGTTQIAIWRQDMAAVGTTAGDIPIASGTAYHKIWLSGSYTV